MFRRIIKFDKNDWKHIWTLFKNMHVQAFRGNYSEAYEAFMWIRVHLSYDSKRKD